MASSAAVSVGDTAVALTTGPTAVNVWNNGPYTIYLGGAAVTVENGRPLVNQSGLDVPIDLGINEILYAVCADGETSDVRVLKTAPV